MYKRAETNVETRRRYCFTKAMRHLPHLPSLRWIRQSVTVSFDNVFLSPATFAKNTSSLTRLRRRYLARSTEFRNFRSTSFFPSPRKLNDCQHRRSDKSPRKRRRFDAKCRPRRRRGSCTEIDGQSHSSRWILALSRRETGSRWSTLPSRERERQMRFFRLGWARESLIYHRGRMGLIVRRVVCAASSVINLTLVCRYCWLYGPSL